MRKMAISLLIVSSVLVQPEMGITATSVSEEISARRNVLVGTDHNVNGVRDDVDKWIMERFQKGEDRNKAAAIQFSTALQSVFEVGDVRAIDEIAARREIVRRAISCIIAVSDGNSDAMFKELMDVIIDTPERLTYMADIEEAYTGDPEMISPDNSSCQ